MQIARVIGTVVSTQKHRKFHGAKLLLVQPINPDDSPRGTALLAVDGVGAGITERVLIVLEGRAAGEAINQKAAPVDAAIVGIIDRVDLEQGLGMPSILVTRKLPSAIIEKLESVGSVEVYQGEGAMPADELRRRVAGKQALVSMLTEQIDAAVIDAGTDLKVISNVAVGYNNIDLKYARGRGILVTNTPDVLTESVADFTWALILAITRRLSEGERLLRRGDWKGWAFDFMLGSELRGKQLGLLGFGRIAQAVARKAPAFGMRVAYSSRREMGVPDAEFLSLDRLLVTSDIVSIHVPLNQETRHLVDRRAFTRMKRSAYLVNTSRGPVVDEGALAWALQQHLLAGAALDVYENEPVVHPDLFGLENVLLVPHLGSGTTETRAAMAGLAADNVVAVLSGRPPLTPITS